MKNPVWWKSFSYALKGIAQASKTERNLRTHLLAAGAALLLAAFLKVKPVEWALLIVIIGVVISAELINTAIEILADQVWPEEHPLAGRAKDIAAGAVLVTAISAVFVGLLVFWPYVMR